MRLIPRYGRQRTERPSPRRSAVNPLAGRWSPTARLKLEALEGRELPSFGFGWASDNSASSPGSDSGNGVATDALGNVYVSGSLNGPTVVKYSAAGQFQWATPVGGGVGGGGIAVQGNNVYVAGGGVAQLDANTGAVGWTVSIPGSQRVAVGAATGKVYVMGRNASSQVFVTQLSASGVLQWTQTTSSGADWSSRGGE